MLMKTAVLRTGQFLVRRWVAVVGLAGRSTGQCAVDQSQTARLLVLCLLKRVAAVASIETTITSGAAAAHTAYQEWNWAAPGGLIPGRPVITGTFDGLIRFVQRIRRACHASPSRRGRLALTRMDPRVRWRRRTVRLNWYGRAGSSK